MPGHALKGVNGGAIEGVRGMHGMADPEDIERRIGVMDDLLQAVLKHHFQNPHLHAFLEASEQGINPEAVLREAQSSAVVDDVDGDDGEAALEDPRVHNSTNGFAGCRFDGVPEVGRFGGAVGVLCEVLADAHSELVFAEVLLKHANNRSTFFVGEDVEHAFGIGG